MIVNRTHTWFFTLLAMKNIRAQRSPVREVRLVPWRSVMGEKAIACEWLLNLGQREAAKRAAHLFCELRVRLRAVGLAQDDSFEFPLTQPELGDVLGLSSIHVNRVPRALREAGFVRIKYGWLTMLDAAALERFADFDPIYLQDA